MSTMRLPDLTQEDLLTTDEAACQIPRDMHPEQYPCREIPVAVFRTECGQPPFSGRLVCEEIVRAVAGIKRLTRGQVMFLRVLGGACMCGRDAPECWSTVPI